ncbi:putative vacuolar carboxypeptidase Cps1 [Rhizodiscina lignyota]|uniref:Vacuolar carboxypeptidase Cps1 n=1 Tax=Rhizodiscina lignyota TaxID=1504668 RepID=A0A9P4M147_9PEZI|nr:putative vacuolar carboxypeptidase Cps1 [Rhizodiscina lignyota]
MLAISLIFAGLFTYTQQNGFHFTSPFHSSPLKEDAQVDFWCPLAPIPGPPSDGLKDSRELTGSDIRQRQVERLSAAVNVSTQSFEDSGDVETDTRWRVFDELHEVLRKLFPLVHENLHVEKVNKYGILYTWKGSTVELKPILFMAHQDVVPSGPAEKWTYAPFQAHYDGQFVWGRGASDCKNNLIGLLSTAEELLRQRWTPKRTIILAFGFDEEIGGERGAKHIAQHLEKILGKDSLAMVHDEGGMGFQEMGDMVYALPAIAEKGFVDIVLHVKVKGGHSSRPPPHTGIGIASEIVVELEKHPFVPRLTASNPLMNLLQCQVRYSPREVEDWLPDALASKWDEVTIGKDLARSRGPDVRFAMQTSQAVTIFNGGEKDNQLPDSANITINYRIAPHDSVDKIRRSVLDVISPIAKQHDLSIEELELDSQGSLLLSTRDDLEPSPVSPTADSNAVWKLFGGTIRSVFEDVESFKGKTIVAVGDIMLGNTDTVHYWNLTRNIYRFSPARAGTRINVHTIDERIDMDAHLEGMRLYYELMRNFDILEDKNLS